MIFHKLCNIVHKIGNKLVEFFKEKAFTLAEIMVALVVIGVITSILLPVAFNNLPNENVMKFKKGNATLAKVINELVMSDRYYKDGDLGVKADGSRIDDSSEENIKYFCKTFSDILNTKSVECSKAKTLHTFVDFADDNYFQESIKQLDTRCKEAASSVGAEIVTPDNITYYLGCPAVPFGITYIHWNTGEDFPSGSVTCGMPTGLFYLTAEAAAATSCDGYEEKQKRGTIRIHRVFCMDVDGINKGEDPFGYGIRVDGKIILGARAQEWLNKNIQDKE